MEHERVYYFENSSAEPLVYLSSADLMPRNLKNRIEQCTPILNETIKNNIINDLEIYLKDNTSSWLMQADGKYIMSIPIDQNGDESLNFIDAQQTILENLAESY